MTDAGALWIVRPERSKDIAERDVFAAAKEAGLVDTKVVPFSRMHTAHQARHPARLARHSPPPARYRYHSPLGTGHRRGAGRLTDAAREEAKNRPVTSSTSTADHPPHEARTSFGPAA
jgi:hypothetical protein